MTVDELATFEYDEGSIEILSSSIWNDDPQGVRVLRTKELTEFDFILLVSEEYVVKMRADGSIIMFLWAMKKLGQELMLDTTGMFDK